MVKKKDPLNTKEIFAEKKLQAGKKQSSNPFTKGDAFVEEPTGSASMVNLDGK